ncbi:MAG: ribosomal protein S18-alanine N-acetyltransferase [Candidatus Brocadiales bacterium]
MGEFVRYRRTSLEDVSQIEEMEEANFAEEAFSRRQIRYLLQSPNTISLTAYRDSKVLGYIMGLGRRGSSIVRIYTFCVRRDYRVKGVGTSLLQRLEKECQKRGIFSLVLEVGEDNLPARRFYESNGFVEFSRVPEYYRDGTNAIRMRKTVASSQG